MRPRVYISNERVCVYDCYKFLNTATTLNEIVMLVVLRNSINSVVWGYC